MWLGLDFDEHAFDHVNDLSMKIALDLLVLISFCLAKEFAQDLLSFAKHGVCQIVGEDLNYG